MVVMGSLLNACQTLGSDTVRNWSWGASIVLLLGCQTRSALTPRRLLLGRGVLECLAPRRPCSASQDALELGDVAP